LRLAAKQDVDARVKPGHDEWKVTPNTERVAPDVLVIAVDVH